MPDIPLNDGTGRVYRTEDGRLYIVHDTGRAATDAEASLFGNEYVAADPDGDEALVGIPAPGEPIPRATFADAAPSAVITTTYVEAGYVAAGYVE